MPGEGEWSKVGSRGHSPLIEEGRGRGGILGLCGVQDRFVRLMVNGGRKLGGSYQVKHQFWPKMEEQGLY